MESIATFRDTLIIRASRNTDRPVQMPQKSNGLKTAEEIQITEIALLPTLFRMIRI